MKEYIERERLKEAFNADLQTLQTLDEHTMDLILIEIDEAPAADVAEVVRCKDCQYYQDAKTNKKGFLICPASGMEITETDYCSYGAHMDKEDENA